MINKWRVHRDYDWTILAFPKQNRSIVWNDTNKTYDFYEGTPWEQEKIKEFNQHKKSNEDQINRWKRICCWMAAVLGIILGAGIAIALATL